MTEIRNCVKTENPEIIRLKKLINISHIFLRSSNITTTQRIRIKMQIKENESKIKELY